MENSILNHYSSLYRTLEKERAGSAPAWLNSYRQAAFARLEKLGFPTKNDESWHATNIGQWIQTPFQLNSQTNTTLTKNDLLSYQLDATEKIILTWVNGHFTSALSEIPKMAEGVILMPLSEAYLKHGELIQKNLQTNTHQDSAFTLLNDSFASDGLFLYIPKGVKIEKPIEVLFINEGENPLINSIKNMIIAERHAEATVVELHVGLSNSSYLSNPVTLFTLKENAHVDHYKLNEEGNQSIHVGAIEVHQEQQSRFSTHAFALGGHFNRCDISARLDGLGAECVLNGLFLGQQKQVVDHHIRIDHLKPHTSSRQNFRGILDGESKGIFNGTVIVHQGASKSEAHQSIKNLLLSDKAEALPEPMLKILNDDVKCTHGATVGQLDKNALFYLRSRGISFDEARTLLTYAFAGDLIAHIGLKNIQCHLLQAVLNRLSSNEILRGIHS